ncbi:MAG TPA: choice-of-anchor tandem repeat GloVer-containing protein, partial [Candidatus Cybelea sp.]
GANADGAVFELKPSGSSYKEKLVHSFAGADGRGPADALVSDGSGNLYGTTFYGGGGSGTVFKLTPSGSTYTESVIYGFQGGTDGSEPTASLLRGPHGVFYGLTGQGGHGGVGTVFEVAPEGSHYRETVLYSFNGLSDGDGPVDTPGLVADRVGNLYGTTVAGGGTCDCGTVFRLVRSGKGFTEHVLYTFQGGPGDGAKPYGSVVIDRHGNLLGPTFMGGSSNSGTIFSLCCAPPPR